MVGSSSVSAKQLTGSTTVSEGAVEDDGADEEVGPRDGAEDIVAVCDGVTDGTVEGASCNP